MSEGKNHSRSTMLIATTFGALFFGYVGSAPLLHDGRGFPLRIHKPVWSAAAEGPFSGVLRPYFRLWGIEFQPSYPEPPRPNYE
jgi:hypothetical protein